jgi:hypothetical protein
MTDDIVARLRGLADCDARSGEPLGKCMREAADEIERLHEERDELVQTSAMLCEHCGWRMKFPNNPCCHCEGEILRAEIARKDAALRKIAENLSPEKYDNHVCLETISHKIARAALAPAQEKTND